MIFQNVVDDEGEIYQEKFVESGTVYQIGADSGFQFKPNSYRGEFYFELSKLLKNFDDYLFCEYDSDDFNIPAVRFHDHKNKVLMWRAGEKKLHQIKEVKQYFTHVFANYYWDEDGVTSIPLGYNNYFDKNEVPVNERNYDISFIGALNNHRIPVASEITGIHRYLISYGLYKNPEKTLRFLNNFCDWTKKSQGKYFFTWEFNTGISSEHYCNILLHSKIALAPKGWINTETFRMYEAMKYGCVVVADVLPERNYYKNIPVIQVENWKDGFKQIRGMLKNKKLMHELSLKHKAFYDEYLSPKATAKIVADKLNSIKLK